MNGAGAVLSDWSSSGTTAPVVGVGAVVDSRVPATHGVFVRATTHIGELLTHLSDGRLPLIVDRAGPSIHHMWGGFGLSVP